MGDLFVAAGVILLIAPAAHLAIGLRAQSGSLPSDLPGIGRAGERAGRLEIPRVGLDLIVYEGTSEADLRRGPGHVPGTAWPGVDPRRGNCVIAGHRDSFFRRLAGAREGDIVRLRTASGVWTYRLSRRRIVRPEEVSVLAPTPEARLTLITCYPFRFTGAAPYRLVWEARRVDFGF